MQNEARETNEMKTKTFFKMSFIAQTRLGKRSELEF